VYYNLVVIYQGQCYFFLLHDGVYGGTLTQQQALFVVPAASTVVKYYKIGFCCDLIINISVRVRRFLTGNYYSVK
ncbi:MAG: hypothetical protein ABL876_16670, partial [Chitinophagaceae bacterium]